MTKQMEGLAQTLITQITRKTCARGARGKDVNGAESDVRREKDRPLAPLPRADP